MSFSKRFLAAWYDLLNFIRECRMVPFSKRTVGRVWNEPALLPGRRESHLFRARPPHGHTAEAADQPRCRYIFAPL